MSTSRLHRLPRRAPDASRCVEPGRPGLPFFKVCCIASAAEAKLAVRLGASALGLVSAMPSGPGVIDEQAIAAIVPTVPPEVLTVLLTSATRAETILAQVQRTGVGAVQLCDRVPSETHRALRRAFPELVLIQVVHVLGEGSLCEALELDERPELDALLLDSGNPGAATKTLGGTGRIHDWSLSERIVRSTRLPVLLAGGLRPENADRALASVRPFGLDVCTGVRVDGRLDAERLGAFVAALGPGR